MEFNDSRFVLIDPDPAFWSKTSWLQFAYGIWVNMTMVSVGMVHGFTTVTLPQLQSSTSKLLVTINEVSWIASVVYLAAPMGSLVSGCVMDHCGRRVSLVLSGVPLLIGWVVTSTAYAARELIAGRIIAGVGCGMALVVASVYITEFTLPNMRGVIGSFPSIGTSIGYSIEAALGAFLDWHVIALVNAVFAFILFATYFFLPESPYYILMNKSEEKTKETLKKFRSRHYDINSEFEDMKDFKKDNEIRRLTRKEEFEALLKISAYKPFSIIVTYLIIAQCSGSTVVVIYSVELFQESKSSVNTNLGTFLMSVMRIMAGVLLAFLLFKVLRKTLAVIGAIGVSISCVSLGIFASYADEPSVIPQLFFFSYVIFCTFTYNVLPVLLMTELYPLQIRGLLTGISISIANLLTFGAIKTFPFLLQNIGFVKVMYVFGTISFFGSLVLFFILPETKGLTLQEIEEFFNNRSPTLTSQRQLVSVQRFSKTHQGSSKNSQDFRRSRSKGSLQKVFRRKDLKRISKDKIDKKEQDLRKDNEDNYSEIDKERKESDSKDYEVKKGVRIEEKN